MNIDWSKAPEGATHFDSQDKNWLQQFSGISLVWDNKRGWSNHHGQYPRNLSESAHVIARPAEKKQAGDLSAKGLPPLESIIRIVPGNTTIWDVAEQFVGVDCRLKAVFMLDETQMVAVECIESGQCCCFWASMVRTPEQAKAEERMSKAIALYTAVMNHPGSSLWHRLDSERQEHFLSLIDAGWQQVKP